VKKAYDSWRGQNERCNNKANKAYRYYGAKGIQVTYSSREFVTWWLEAMRNFPTGAKLTVNRRDANLNYSFDNIELVPWAQNVAEANRRTKANSTWVYCVDSKALLGKYSSETEAAVAHGMDLQTVSKHCRRKFTPGRSTGKIAFRYCGDSL